MQQPEFIDGRVNANHPEAYKKLQKAAIGKPLYVAWKSKHGKTMYGVYYRSPILPNKRMKPHAGAVPVPEVPA